MQRGTLLALILSLGLSLRAQEMDSTPLVEPPPPAVESAAPTAAAPSIGAKLQNLTLENWTTNAFGEITAALAGSQDWKAPSQDLSQWLAKQYNATAVTKPGWIAMSGLQRWCEFFGDHAEAVAKLDPETVPWLLNDRDLTSEFFAILSPRDKAPQVLAILQDAHKGEPKRFPTYNRLAIAMAVVWDVPPPPSPHHQVNASKVPMDTSTTLDRFRFWAECNDRKACDFDLTKLELEQLKFLVDATQPLDELKWAQTAVRFTRSNFDQAFSSIRYDQGRLDQGVFSWPHGPYTLKEIRKLGGICVDQAYFASVAGKANGIPTLFFTGEGRRGGHAWFGYMKTFDRWNMDCGRYQYDKYATGTATDPQTNEPISDHELGFLAEPFRNSPEYRASTAHVRQAQVFVLAGDPANARIAVETALKLSPLNVNAWELKTSLLEKDPNLADELKKHLNTMAGQFVRYADIKAASLTKLAALSREGGDEKAADQMENRIIHETHAKRHDLSAEVYRKKMEQAIADNDWKGGRDVVKDAMSKLRTERGVVLDLTQSFIRKCVENGQYDEASRVLADFRNKMQPDGRMGRDLEELQKLIKEGQKAQRKGK